MGGKVEKSFIWISSHNLHELSKIDTVTMTELARYKTGPAGENPSRTAVSADGRFMVVNNRDSGRSTMVAANEEDCVDKNGNGQIDTSQNKANILAFGSDECVRWSIVLPYAGNHQSGPRGVTWTPGDWDYNLCKYVEPKVWVGYLAAGNVAHFARIDGETGMVEETLLAPGWKGASGYGPYGAALDPQFRPWFSSLRSEFIRVNTDQNPITLTRIDPPAYVQSYGMTIDRDGDAWFGGWTGPVTVYEQKSGTFTAIPGTAGGAHRGVAADENFVWAANNNPCELVQVDRKARTLIAKHKTNPCSTAIGLSIDVEKYVWLVNQGGFAFKFAPDNVAAMKKVDVVGSHYVYSDMTGGQLLSILPQ
nr:lyase [Nannocystis sp.]